MSAGVQAVNTHPSLTQAGLLVLLALASGEFHGYAVMRLAEETTRAGRSIGEPSS